MAMMNWKTFTTFYHHNTSMMDIGVALREDNMTIFIGNDTIDVMVKGCFGDFDTIACARNGVMSILVLLTCALCIVKVCRLHVNRHPTLHQFIIFYCATVECLLCAIHWVLGTYAQLDFIAQYMKLIQFLVVSHFYWTLASRALRKENFSTKLLIPMYVGAFIYFTITAVLGCINITPTWLECFQPYWIALSSAEFGLVQMFMIAGIYITRRLNEISTLDSVRRAQKRDLWSLIITFELSALIGLIYDITVKILGDEENGCSGVFLHMQKIYTPVFGTFMIVKFLLPIWAMLFVFHPLEVTTDQEDLLPAISEEGTYTSVFTPPYDTRHRYKPLFQPGSEGLTPDSDFTPSPTSASSTPVYGPLRRTGSNLATIREENHEGEGAEETARRPILS